jgi:hypothetical protein
MNTFGGTTYDQQSLTQQAMLSAGKNHLPTLDDGALAEDKNHMTEGQLTGKYNVGNRLLTQCH